MGFDEFFFTLFLSTEISDKGLFIDYVCKISRKTNNLTPCCAHVYQGGKKC